MSKHLETYDYLREEHSSQKEEEEEGPEARACSLLPETEKRSAWLKGLTRGITGNEDRKASGGR